MSIYEFEVDETGETCEHAGHEWVDAGGGLQICGVCQAERWADDEELEDDRIALKAQAILAQGGDPIPAENVEGDRYVPPPAAASEGDDNRG